MAIDALEKKKFDRMAANFHLFFNNKLPARPKIRPNKYPFEIKETPQEYARPRVRPDEIEELAANSQIFSDSQLGQSIKPKVRPKFIAFTPSIPSTPVSTPTLSAQPIPTSASLPQSQPQQQSIYIQLQCC